MPDPAKPEQTDDECLRCGKLVKPLPFGNEGKRRMRRHNDPRTGERCPESGQVVEVHV